MLTPSVNTYQKQKVECQTLGLPKRLHSKWSPVGWVSPQLVESRQSFRACECQPNVDVEFQSLSKIPLAALWQPYARFRIQAHDIGFSEPLPNHKPISSAEGKEVTLTKWMPCGKVWWQVGCWTADLEEHPDFRPFCRRYWKVFKSPLQIDCFYFSSVCV